MDRKQQLQELIQLNKQAVSETHSNISALQEELEEIQNQERKPPSKKFLQLLDQFRLNPLNETLRAELTTAALKTKQGNFAVWRGGLTNGPNAQYLEIAQPAFNSENRLIDPPVIIQHFEAIYVDSLEDLKALLPLNPTGLVSLPTQAFSPFSSFRNETVTSNLERIYQPLYDTQVVEETGTAQLNFFQIPLGGTGYGGRPPKTQVQTNMGQGGSLPYPKNFEITGISVYPEATTSYEDAVKLMEHAWVRLFIGCSDYLTMPLSAVAIGSAKRNPLISFRLSNPCLPVQPLSEPITLISQQNFRVEINFPVPQQFSRPFFLKAVLHGYFTRRILES